MALSLTKPLSYPCQNAILSYMDANNRIHLSLKCPGIRTADKNVPLKVSSLALNPLECYVNGNVYEVDYIRKNHVRNTDQSQLMSNDVERFAFPNATHLQESETIKEWKRLEVENLEKLKDIENQISCVSGNQGIKRRKFEDNGTLKSLEKRREILLDRLLAVRNNLGVIRPLEYTDFVQFSFNGTALTRREVNLPAYTVMENFIKRIFGERDNVHVDKLRLDILRMPRERFDRQYRGLISRSSVETLLNALPDNVNLRINHLWMMDGAARDRIQPKAQRLRLAGRNHHENVNHLRQKLVHYDHYPYHILNIVKSFLEEKDREIGTRWTFDINEGVYKWVRDYLMGYQSKTRIQFPHANVNGHVYEVNRNLDFTYRVVHQMNETSEIHQYCEHKEDDARRIHWTHVLEVLPLGTRNRPNHLFYY